MIKKPKLKYKKSGKLTKASLTKKRRYVAKINAVRKKTFLAKSDVARVNFLSKLKSEKLKKFYGLIYTKSQYTSNKFNSQQKAYYKSLYDSIKQFGASATVNYNARTSKSTTLSVQEYVDKQSPQTFEQLKAVVSNLTPLVNGLGYIDENSNEIIYLNEFTSLFDFTESQKKNFKD